MASIVEVIVLKLKRAESPGFRAARKVYDFLLTANLPVPRAAKPAGRLVYDLQLVVGMLWKRFKALIYIQPVFRCRCESVGKRLSLIAMPSVQGHTSLFLGDDVRLSGSLGVASGRVNDRPSLHIGNRVFIGHDVHISCNREVVIEDDVMIAGCCRISDNDGHPTQMKARIAGQPPAQDAIKPVRICRGAWIGSGTFILKGVTIGEGSIVGASSVVTKDVPSNSVVAGSPARVVKQGGETSSSDTQEAVAAHGEAGAPPRVPMTLAKSRALRSRARTVRDCMPRAQRRAGASGRTGRGEGFRGRFGPDGRR
jgi:acetyltransferase-like isoleucine patch superfamily enzyme